MTRTTAAAAATAGRTGYRVRDKRAYFHVFVWGVHGGGGGVFFLFRFGTGVRVFVVFGGEKAPIVFTHGTIVSITFFVSFFCLFLDCCRSVLK